MGRILRHDLTYDAPLEAVATMLADPAFREEVCVAQHVLRHDVTISGVAGEAPAGPMEVRVEVVHGSTYVPSFARKIVGEEIIVVQSESWTAPEHGDLAVTIPGKPGTISGTADLTGSGGATTETVEMSIKVGIPLIGGKLEGLVEDLLLKALKTENRVGREWLTRG